MKKTDLNGIDEIKKLIKLRQEYFEIHNHIITVCKLLYHTDMMLRNYFSTTSIRKDNATSGNIYAFIKHEARNDIDALRDIDMPIRIYFNLISKEIMRWDKLSRLTFEQYCSHKKLIDTILFIDTNFNQDIRQNEIYSRNYSAMLDDQERWCSEHTVDELLHTPAYRIADEPVFGYEETTTSPVV